MSSNTQRSSVALRHLIVAALTTPHGDSLVGLNTYELPDGALAFVNATQGAYRLDRAMLPADAPGAGPAYVLPTAGPGVWVLQNSGSLFWASFDGTNLFTVAAPQTVVQNTWNALPIPGDSPILYEGGGPGDFWTIDESTGIITYTGPSGKAFAVTANLAAYCSSADNVLDVALTLNSALLGTTTTVQTSSQTIMGSGEEPLPEAVSHTLIITLDQDDTLQHVFRNLTATPGDVGFTRYLVTIVPV